MRADLMKWLAPKIGARDAVLLVLLSDYEAMLSKTDGWGCRPRTLKGLQEFNASITKMTLWRLVKEGHIVPEKNGWRLRLVSN